MTSYGRLNLLGMFGLPLIAVIASIIMFGPRGDTIVFVFGTNFIPMLIGGLISGLMLRASNKSGKGHLMALLPTLIPAGLAAVWYLYGALISSSSDAGREYMALPFYLIGWVVIVGIIATVAHKVASN
jgi:hypothetical protein